MAGGSFLWLASFPKSGNTWMRLFLATLERSAEIERLDDLGAELAMLHRRGEMDARLGLGTADLLPEETLALRPHDMALAARRLGGPTFSKVHDGFIRTPAGDWLFPPAVTAGAIYIARDPRDVAVSYAHHGGRSIDATIELIARDSRDIETSGEWPSRLRDQRLGWSRHVESWLDAPDQLRRLVVRYEDMLAAPLATFGAVAAFVGLPTGRDAVAAAIEATRFERLREREAGEGFSEKMNGEFFFRQGRAGAWRDVLSPAQAARIVADHGPVMRRLGYPTD